MFEDLKKIGNGKESEVFLDGDFIIKKYNNERGLFFSFKIWNFLKNNNFNTFKNYDKINNNCIRMENLSKNNKFCVSTIGSNICEENIDATYLKNNKISEILNFENFINSGFDDIDRFWKLNFDLGYTDVFFFIGNKELNTNLELFYGDLEKCNTEFKVSVPQIKKLYLAIIDFLNYFVEKENSVIYRNFLDSEYKKRIDSYEQNGIKFMSIQK